jgi:hypothetical protein
VNIVAAAGNTERSNADVNIVAVVAGNTVDGSTERTNAEVETNTARDGCAARSTERGISAVGVHSRIVASNSERTSVVRGEVDACGRVTTNVHSRLNGDVNSNQNIGSKRGCQAPTKRGRAKMARTALVVPPRSGKVELEPVGHW